MQGSELLKWAKAHSRVVILLPIIAGNIFLFTLLYQREHGVLTVAFLDVGQGDAVFIEAPNGNQMLYDAGPPSGATLRALSFLMPWYDRSIDVVVLSHPDMDHIGGFPEIFKRYEITLAMEPGATSDNGVYEEVVAKIAKEGSVNLLARRGMRIELGAGAYADILYPDRDMSRMETNSASIVMRVVYGESSFLFSGDLPSGIEEYVVGLEGDELSSSVLKLGHHGSRTSTSAYFLSAVRPKIAIISAEANSRYGHPHKEVLERLTAANILSFETSKEGTIVFQSDGNNVLRR